MKCKNCGNETKILVDDGPAPARLRQLRLRVQRRVLWRQFSSKAVYKPYKDLRGQGSGWAWRWIWRNRVIAYVDRAGNLWW